MASDLIQQMPLALYWVAYAVIHSVLAANATKAAAATLPGLSRHYRLIYNVLALVLLLPIGWSIFQTPGPWIWAWHGAAQWIANGLCLGLAVLLFFRPVGYDTRAFVGLEPESQNFVIGPWHRFVRHPWYFVGIVLIWTRDMNLAMLVSAVMMTTYFIIGSWLEEAKLIATIGEPYRIYRSRVGGLIPLPWKILDPNAARQISESAARPALVARSDPRNPEH